jgi:dTDP-4-dehydrorhamnose 3,5-epimerase
MALGSKLLPSGVRARRLGPYPDERGVFIEIFRQEWDLGDPIQWNYTESIRRSFRGMKVHPMHDDIVILLAGRMCVGLRDLRRGASTYGCSVVVDMTPDGDAVLTVPHGVAHGLYFPEATRFLIGVNRYWDPEDELGCRYDDPELEIDWPEEGLSSVSDSDLAAGPLSALMARIEPWQPFSDQVG